MTRSANRGFTLVEIMIVVAIIALLAAIAIPNVLRGRTTANETAVIGNMRALISSLEMERSVNNVYPLDIAANTWLARMYGAGAVPAACAALIAPDPDFGPPSFCVTMLTSPVQGFNYTYAVGAAAGQTYTILAVPVTVGTTGTRSFVADQTGLIRHCTGTGTAAAMTDGTPAPTIDAAVAACD